MIRHLLITNYGLIEKIELQLEKGLTAITGETGSGKSILLGAFSMLLGERADSKAIKNPELKCVVEGTFNLKGYNLKSFFQKEDLDYDDTTTIRREIAPGGKSRSFINDTPVSLNTLKSLGEKLVDIHSQHENSILSSRDFQFNVVDAFASNESLLISYSEKFSVYKKKKTQLDELKSNEVKMKQDLDYFQFQLEELTKATLEEINQELLEQELETLTLINGEKDPIELDIKIEADFDTIPKEYHEVFFNMMTARYYSKASFGDNPFSVCQPKPKRKWYQFWKSKY